MEVSISNAIGSEDETITWIPFIQGGVEPYDYQWKNSLREPIGFDETLIFQPLHTAAYSLTVTDAWGTSVSDKAIVTVSGRAYTATFDDLYLDAESNWSGDADADTDEYLIESEFFSGSYGFNNIYMPAYASWAFWGYSNETSTEYSNLSHQYRSAVGHGVDGSSNYAVAFADSYMGVNKVRITHKPEGDSLNGCFISNTAWVKESILNGDGISNVPGGFAQNDSLVLIATGKNGDWVTGSVRFLLADYRAADEIDHYYLDTWQWMDMRALGKVTEVTFSLAGSKSNSWGLTTPTYFCMDDFNGLRPETEVDETAVPQEEYTLSIAPYFSFDSAMGSIDYRIIEGCDEDILSASLVDDHLLLNGISDGNTDLLLSPTQKGKMELVRLPVRVDEAVRRGEKE